MRNIEEIAWDLCCLYYENKPPINSSGELEYYLAGSLATLPMLCAERIQDLVIDENGIIIGANEPMEIDDSVRTIFQSYRRKINDADYVSVKSEPNKVGLVDKINTEITDMSELSDLGTNVIHISDPREQSCSYNVSLIEFQGKKIVIPSPIDIISFKLSQCVGRKKAIQKRQLMEQSEKNERIINKHNEAYLKQIRDFIPLAIGVSKLYSSENIITRMKEIMESENNFDHQIIEEIKTDLSQYPEITELFDGLNKSKTI